MFLSRCFLVLSLLTTAHANAAVTINIWEENGDVRASVAGSINLNAGTYVEDDSINPGVLPSRPFIGFDPSSAQQFSIFQADNLTSFEAFGTGSGIAWSSQSGVFAINMRDGNPLFYVDTNYVSGSALAASGTIADTTLAATGMTPGTYTNAFGSGGVSESITIIVGRAPGAEAATAIPATPGWSLALIGMLAGVMGWRKLKG